MVKSLTDSLNQYVCPLFAFSSLNVEIVITEFEVMKETKLFTGLDLKQKEFAYIFHL